MRRIDAATPLRRCGLPVAVIIGAAAVALLAAACVSRGGSSGSGGSPQAGGSTRSSSALAFSACMRSHGVPTFPDPDSNGGIPKVTPRQLGVGSSQFQAAQTAGDHLLKPNHAQAQLTLSGMLDFAR